MIEEPQDCTFKDCGFKPIGDCGELDQRHIYCLHCSGTVHLFAEIVGHSRFGSCPNCKYRHTVGVKEDGFIELRDETGKFVLGIDGSI